jgi:pyruvate-ferredoxin/flavodoxin oxidoreductase
MQAKDKKYKYPGIRRAMDGNSAVIHCEQECSDAATTYPIMPSAPMGAAWVKKAAKGHVNTSGKRLHYATTSGGHGSAAVTSGFSMTGLRAANFTSGQGAAHMHESLYTAAGKRLPYVLNMGCRAMAKGGVNIHAGHDDYHAVDDTGFFQVFAKNAQEVSDLNLVAHRVAELALSPGIVAQDGFLTTHLMESLRLPERALIAEYLGQPEDMIETPTPAQKLLFGEKRRRIPQWWDVDSPVVSGAALNQDVYMQSIAAQRPFFFDHLESIADEAMAEFKALTGRAYARLASYRVKDADYLILGQGSVVGLAEAVADHLRDTRGVKVGVVNVTMFRPFPGDLLGALLKGRKGVTVLERTDQPLAEDLPLMREIRAALSKCQENGRGKKEVRPYPDYASYGAKDAPLLYSGAFGLGGRDLQPEGVIGALENMLEDGANRRFFYLSTDFSVSKPTPKQEIYQQEIADGYPGVADLSVRGSENPDLMPEGSLTIRIHSRSGWGAVRTGKTMSGTLFGVMGYDVKASAWHGLEKKGSPTIYYLCAAPERIRVTHQYKQVDAVLSPDPQVFEHADPLAGLKEGGILVLQSDGEDAEAAWNAIPHSAQQTIVARNIQVYYLNGFHIAREEAFEPELQQRMQGIAFEGAFFSVSPLMKTLGVNEERLFESIRLELEEVFSQKGGRIIRENMAVVRRGFGEVQEITEKTVSKAPAESLRKESGLPVMLKPSLGGGNCIPAGQGGVGDVHRFWEQTGCAYAAGRGGKTAADPFIGLGLMPAATSVFRDLTPTRIEHPQWSPSHCTGCGKCYTVCPDSAIPGLVHSLSEILETTVQRVEVAGHPVKHLSKAIRTLERKWRAVLTDRGEGADVRALMNLCITATIAESDLDAGAKVELEAEFEHFKESIGPFKFAVTRPYFTLCEQESPGSGGLFSVTVNPNNCKGCMACVSACADDALHPMPQNEESIDWLRRVWDFWRALPTTSPDYIRIEDIDEGIGALETLLLDKKNYQALMGGDTACAGCGEKTAVHLFTAAATALMQPRVRKHVEYLDDLIARLERHVRLQLANAMDISDIDAIERAVDKLKNQDLTLTNLSANLADLHPSVTLDPEWLKWATRLLASLRQLRTAYAPDIGQCGRASLGVVNATGCTSSWGATHPYSPYPFPWASNLMQDAPALALGVFEGHMAKMADGFKTMRMAELELKGDYSEEKDGAFFAQFGWEDFDDTEFALCPPVTVIGGDAALGDTGLHELSGLLSSGKPIKVLVLDTQACSSSGGQASSATFTGQVSDLAPFGDKYQGKMEARSEIALLAIAHRNTYVLQGAISNTTHLLEGFIQGINVRRPAVFNIYCPCQPEHGIGDDSAVKQSQLAVESRAFPLFRYHPDLGAVPTDCLSLDANPAIEADWPNYTMEHVDDENNPTTLDIPLTFADFAVTESRFKNQFQPVPPNTPNDVLTPLVDFLELDQDEREDVIPCLWTLDQKNQLVQVVPSTRVVLACEERRAFWRLLKGLAGVDRIIDPVAIASQARSDMTRKLATGLMELVVGSGNGFSLSAFLPSASGAAAPAPASVAAPAEEATAPAAVPKAAAPAAAAAPAGYTAPWIDTNQCTTCDECTNLNPRIFAYNDKKKAFIKDPKGGPFKDLVRAAEKCTAKIIHPGYPEDRSEKGVERLIKRAQRFM